ncbi:MAG: histone deacetylase family protein [Leptospirillia bacterium]
MTPSLPEFFAGYRGLSHDSGPGHPESSARLAAVIEVGKELVLKKRAAFLEVPSEPDLSLARTVHDGSYIDFLEGLSPASPSAPLDADTQVGGPTVVALRETLGAVRSLAGTAPGRSRRCFLAMRPPGHHAHSGGGMGFCAINPLAILLAARQRANPQERIAIFDFDVHHGNGTADIVGRLPGRDRILFVSTHRYPFYPGTGSGRDNHEGPQGEGVLDIPLRSGTDDEDYREIFEDVVRPRFAAFAPQTVLVSAGFDAHRDDPLGDMALTKESYHRIGRWLGETAPGLCVAFLEGGYNLHALLDSSRAFLSGWFED